MNVPTNPLTQAQFNAWHDLVPHEGEYDYIVCAGDFHGTALAGAIAAFLNKPLMIVCRDRDIPTQSLIVTIGDCDPKGRALYIDDFAEFGASLKAVFAYMNQSAKAPVVATYMCTTRTYKETADGQYAP